MPLLDLIVQKQSFASYSSLRSMNLRSNSNRSWRSSKMAVVTAPSMHNFKYCNETIDFFQKLMFVFDGNMLLKLKYATDERTWQIS